MQASGVSPPRRRWPLIIGLALLVAITLGVGAFLGAALLQPALAAGGGPSGNAVPFVARFPAAGTPSAGAQGPHGQGACDTLTVASVSGNTITAKAGDGTTVTIHTTANTTYTKVGQTATASAVTVGSRFQVRGTHNSDGSVTATAIDVQ